MQPIQDDALQSSRLRYMRVVKTLWLPETPFQTTAVSLITCVLGKVANRLCEVGMLAESCRTKMPAPVLCAVVRALGERLAVDSNRYLLWQPPEGSFQRFLASNEAPCSVLRQKLLF